MVNEGAPTKVSELNENRFYGASDRQIVPKDLAGSVGNHLFKPYDARIYIGIKVEGFPAYSFAHHSTCTRMVLA